MDFHTRAGVAGTILGDALAQYSSYKLSSPVPAHDHQLHTSKDNSSFRYDCTRLLRLLIWSAAVGTPVAHYWFQFLDKNIFAATPKAPIAIISKLLLDQAVMAPAGTASFFAGMKVLEGDPGGALPAVRTKLWPVLLANWSLWPLANAINFAFVPPQQRILYINVLSVMWVAFMSHMAAAHPTQGGDQERPALRRPRPPLVGGIRELGADPDACIVYEAPAKDDRH